MRKIFWAILIILCAVLFAMVIYTPFRDTVVNGLQGTVLEPGINTLSAFIITVQATEFYITYVQPYLILWHGLFWLVIAVLVVKVLWPRRPTVMRKELPTKRELQDKLTPSAPVVIQTATKNPEAVAETVAAEEKVETE